MGYASTHDRHVYNNYISHTAALNANVRYPVINPKPNHIPNRYTYPLPKPGTYPSGAGKPIKVFFFLSTSDWTADMLYCCK